MEKKRDEKMKELKKKSMSPFRPQINKNSLKIAEKVNKTPTPTSK